LDPTIIIALIVLGVSVAGSWGIIAYNYGKLCQSIKNVLYELEEEKEVRRGERLTINNTARKVARIEGHLEIKDD